MLNPLHHDELEMHERRKLALIGESVRRAPLLDDENPIDKSVGMKGVELRSSACSFRSSPATRASEMTAARRFRSRLSRVRSSTSRPRPPSAKGTIEFEVRAALTLVPGSFGRAADSATADIILERRDHVLAINGRLLRFEAGKPFVEVGNSALGYDRRPVGLGLSDGVAFEIAHGLALNDVIKVPAGVSATPPR
jgi:hypothetical protein